MSDVTISVNLSRKQQGELFMKSMRQAARIKELKEALRGIQLLAEDSGDWRIATAAKAALQSGLTPPKTEGKPNEERKP